MKMKMQKTKSKKTLTLVSIILMSLMMVGVFSQVGIFVSADDADNGKIVIYNRDYNDKKLLDKLERMLASNEDVLTPSLKFERISEDFQGDNEDEDENDDEDFRGVNEHEIENVQRLKIEPFRQFTSDGIASYKITVTDLHERDCVAGECVRYTYKLSFEPTTGDVFINEKGDFSDNKIVLEAGESETVSLRVELKQEHEGVNSFVVYSSGIDSEAAVQAHLVFVRNGETEQEDTSFFIGKGFVLSEDETDGFLVDLIILNKDGVLSGKMNMMNSNFKIDGSISDRDDETSVNFELISPRTRETVGKFSGNIMEIGSFLLLRGSLDFEDQTWSLTATSRQREQVKVFPFTDEDEDKKVSRRQVVKIREVVVFEDSEESEAGDVYVRPVMIRRERIFNVIPNPWGNKEVSIEIIQGGKVIKRFIDEYGEETFGKYRVSVGFIDDEENIEIEIEVEEA